MRRLSLVSILLAATHCLGQATTAQSSFRPESGTLILMGMSGNTIVLASDGLKFDTATGKPAPGDSKKIFPVGHFAACFIAGDLVARWKGVQEEVDFTKVIQEWSKAHTNAQLLEAYDAIDSKFDKLLNEMHHKYGFPIDPHGFVVQLGCAGLFMGAPKAYVSNYIAASRDHIERDPASWTIRPGSFNPLAVNAVCDEIVRKRATNQFATYKTNPTIVRYRKTMASKSGQSISVNDLLEMSRVCLDATESDEGRRFEPRASTVGPPNRYAEIDDRHGFRWIPEPPISH